MDNAMQTTATAPARAEGQQQEQVQQHVVPPVDVFETESAITLLADLPGVSREQLTLRVDGETLLLEATATASGPDGMQLDAARIEANLREGVLRLTIPKAEEARPRKIEVQVG
jgi:HSP20 family protein